jgi:hypothetical protein
MLPRWIGRIDPDGRYTLYREKMFKPKFPYGRTGVCEDKWSVYVHVCGLLGADPLVESTVDSSDPTLPYLPLALRVQRAFCQAIAAGEIDPEGLGSSKVLSPRIRAERGSRGITPHGRRTVRNGCHLLEQKYGKDCLAFATFTFPDLSRSDWGRVTENWAKRLGIFQTRLREKLQRKGLPGDIVGCVEIQEKRRRRDGSPALHLHIVFVGRKRGKSWLLTPKQLRQLWKTQWEKVLQSGYVWNATENVQRIVKSASRYLAKYLSKGCNPDSQQDSQAMEVNVQSWYVCSSRLRTAIKNNTHKSYAIGEWLSNAVVDDKDMFSWMSFAEVQGQDGQWFVVCYFGKLREWQPELVYPEGM